MPRKTARRSTNYSRQYDDGQPNDQENQDDQYRQGKDSQKESQQSDRYDKAEGNTDSLIADMAQGFIQAQSKMTDNTASINNMEIALLLQKVNNQLEELKKTNQSSKEKEADNKQPSMQQDSKQQTKTGKETQETSNQEAAGGSSQDLQSLLSSILAGKNNKKNSDSQSSNKQSTEDNSSKEDKEQPNAMTAQNVSQVLAQAQYELANELEASLKKLKKVISESEKLANNISNLLGEETIKKN